MLKNNIFWYDCLRHKKWATSLLLILLVLPGNTLLANPSSAQVAKKLKQVNKLISEKENAFRQQTRALRHFDEQIADTVKSYAALQKEYQLLGLKINEIKTKLASAEEDLNKSTQVNAQLARLYFLASDNNYFKILLQMGNPEQVARNPVYYSYLQKAYTASQKTLKQERTALQQNQQDLQSNKMKLSLLISQKQTKAQELTRKREERKKYLAKLNSEISDAKTLKIQLLKDQERLQKLADQLRHSHRTDRISSGMAFATSKKSLLWPVEGKIIGQYGKKRKISGVRWHGLLIEAKYATPVKAAASGKVVFADWMPGYGFMLIIKHNGDYLSLYGHNQRLLKSVGDRVKRGEQIAEVGSSGHSGVPALYFELRYKGKPVNPQKWFVARANSH